MNSGTNYSGAPTTYTYGVGATLNGTPTRTGYTFTGWTGSNGTTAQTTVTIGTTDTGDKAYTANWTAQTSTVTLKNGSTTVDTVTATYDSAMPTKNTSNANLTMPTATKKVFTGYYDATTGGTQYYTKALASARSWNKTGAQTLYARMADCTCTKGTGVATCTAKSVSSNKCTYDVTYNNGYYGAATQTNSTAGNASYTATATPCTNKPSSNSSYTGPASSNACPWACATGYSTTGKKDGATTGTTSGQSCTAIDDYSVTYTMNGGSCSSTPAATYTYGIGLTLCTPTKTGYTFTGWTGSNGTTAQTSVTISTTDTGDKAYTANWTANQFTVNLNKNNGTGTCGGATGTTAGSITCNYDGTCNVPTWGSNSSDYIDLEYLQSNGTQCINTGYVVGVNDSIEVDYNIEGAPATEQMLIAAYKNGESGYLWVDNYKNSSWYIRFGSGASVNTSIQTSQKTGNNTLVLKKGSFAVNGSNVLSPAYTSMPTVPLAVFCRINGSTPQYNATAKISAVRIKNSSGQIIHNYVPKKRVSDGKFGLYDTLGTPGSNFFVNIGSGADFTGPEDSNSSGLCTITNGTGTSAKILTGWNTKADGTGTNYALGASIQNIISSGSTTLYAVWGTPVCDITNGSATIATSVDNKPVCNVTCTTGYSKTGYLNTTTSGFTTTGAANQTSASFTCIARTYKVTLDSKRYASSSATTGIDATTTGTTSYWYRYKTKSPCYYYKVELASSANEKTANCIAGTYGVSITTPTMAGYTFGGYYTVKTGSSGTQYVTSSGGTTGNLYSTVANDSILFAKWTANSIGTTWYQEDGTTQITVPASAQSCTYDAGVNLPQTPTKQGYTFDGWDAMQ